MAENPYAKYREGAGDSANPYAKYREGAAAEPEPPSRAGEAAQRGFFNAATFNFYDELKGLARAGGFNPDDPETDNEIKALFKGGYRYFTGDPEAEKLYEAEKKRVEAETKALEEQHPYASFGGAVGGAAPSAVALPVRAASMGMRALQAAAGGGVIGGLSGAGAGEGVGGRATGAAVGTGLGAAIGAVAQPAVEVLGTRLAEHLGPVYRSVRAGLLGTESEAQRAVGAGFLRDQPGGRGLSIPEFQQEVAAGTPVALVDLGDTTMRAAARSAANVSPEARAALERATGERYAHTGDRLSGWIGQRFGHPDADARQRAIDVAERTANRGAYGTAYASGPSVWSDRLQEMANLPEVQAAIKAAEKNANTRAFIEGVHYAPLNAKVTVDDAGQLIFQKKGGTTPTYPDLRFWDYTRRELSQEARAAARAGRSDDAGRYGSLARLMNEELDTLVPAYQSARQGAAGFFGAENALEAGQTFFGASRRFQLPEARRALARMTPQQRELFTEGYASRLTDTLNSQGGGARTTMLNRLRSAPDAMAELELGLGGQQAAQEFMARLRVEDIMDRMRNALGNSSTTRQLVELGLAGAGAGGYYGGGDPTHIAGGLGAGVGIALALRTGGGIIGRNINERVSRRVGEMLASNDLRHVQRGIELVTRNPTLRNAFEAGHQALTSTGIASGAQQVTPPTAQFLQQGE